MRMFTPRIEENTAEVCHRPCTIELDAALNTVRNHIDQSNSTDTFSTLCAVRNNIAAACNMPRRRRMQNHESYSISPDVCAALQLEQDANGLHIPPCYLDDVCLGHVENELHWVDRKKPTIEGQDAKENHLIPFVHQLDDVISRLEGIIKDPAASALLDIKEQRNSILSERNRYADICGVPKREAGHLYQPIQGEDHFTPDWHIGIWQRGFLDPHSRVEETDVRVQSWLRSLSRFVRSA